MQYTSIFKRQSFIIVASICAVIIAIVGISYGLFQKKIEGSDFVVRTGNLVVTFNEGTTITNDLVPMSDSNAATLAPTYSFDIENQGTLDAQYDIQIYADSSATGDLIPHEYVKISLDGGEARLLSDLDVVSGDSESNYVYKLGTDSVNNRNAADGKTKTHNVKVWIKETSEESIIGNVVALKLNVISEVKG